MAKLEPKDRIVVESIAEFDPSKTSSSSASLNSFKSLAISSVSNTQTLIYIGTDYGSVILLFLSSSSTSSPARENGHSDLKPENHTLTLSRFVSLTNSPVELMHVFVEIDRILVLSDGYLFLLDSLLLQPPKRLNFPKGVTFVTRRLRGVGGNVLPSGTTNTLGENDSVKFTSSSSRFLKKLGGGSRESGTKSREFSSQLQKEGGNNCLVCVAIGKKIVLVELLLPYGGGVIDTVVLKEIQGVEGVETMVWLDDSIIVGTANGYTLFSSVTGHNVMLFSLPDPSCSPYLKTLGKHHEALLLVDNVGIIVNANGEPIGGSLVFRHSPDSIGNISSYLIAIKDRRMDLYHKKTSLCIQSINFAGQEVGSCILATEEGENGELVVVATPSKVICFRKLSVEEQVKDLLRKKNFKEAIALVEELKCEGEMTKEMLSFVHAQVGFVLLFDLHFEDAVDHFLQSETMEPSEVFPFITRDLSRWSHMIPRKRYWGLHPPPIPLEDVVDEGLMAIQRSIFLRKAGVETATNEDFLLNPPSRADLLESAIQNLIRYLRACREKELNPAIREGVDTLLMYLYRALNHVDDMENLASSENSCVVEELDTLLDESGHLRTLAFLYSSKGMSSKALTIWRILARNYSSGLWKAPAVENGLNLISGQETAATEASKLLKSSSDQDMVLQHLGWIADVDQELAVNILTSDTRTDQLSPERVIEAIASKKVEILQRYLQWLIEEQDSDDSKYHTMYSVSLAESTLEAFKTESVSQNCAAKNSDAAEISEVESQTIYTHALRERLQMFLESSDLYDPDEVLDLIEESELWFEKAILYRKLGQETTVLKILALKLEDSEAAEQYCAEIGRPDAYMQLLDMYLDSQNGKEPMFKAAVRLLHNHGESLDPLQVLKTLSPDMPLQLASDTLLRMMRARIHHHLQSQIVHSLSRALTIDSSLARQEERSRNIQINDESSCDSCHARLGTKLFAMYPDDSVVCYKCYRRLGESTSVSGRNFKRDLIFKPGSLVNR
ncbi:hypothetical protein MKW94_022037 [Papaver nudicaule]|uniref:CNH domain-containing protein n=1 Tax=Papaver nudicaule TaxID=74823 RepID=A0AA41VIT2_PAPNU|nr:hypothetical protein [Papaver nudicaule]